MNIFEKIIADAQANVMLLGKPLNDSAMVDARKTAFASMRSGAGFRIYKVTPRKTVNGLNRTERKKILRDRADAAVRQYHGNLATLRDQNVIGSGYCSPGKAAELLADQAAPAKPKRARTKKAVAA